MSYIGEYTVGAADDTVLMDAWSLTATFSETHSVSIYTSVSRENCVPNAYSVMNNQDGGIVIETTNLFLHLLRGGNALVRTFKPKSIVIFFLTLS